MKKRILLITAAAGMGVMVFSSYSGGPAFNHQNRTGALASATTCGGSGCHGTGASTTVTITVDSGASMTPVTRYVPGHAYTVKIHGTNTSSLAKFGFEFAVVSGTGASQVQAGTCSGFPTNVTSDAWTGLNFVEHMASLPATSAGVYDASFTWTAPAAVGNITMYCTLNAVNGNTSADASDISGNTSVVLTVESPLGVSAVAQNLNVVAFPNPVVNNLNLQFGNAEAGYYTVSVFDLNGRMVHNEAFSVNGSAVATINASNWLPGYYQVAISNGAAQQVIPVVKQ